MQREVLPDTDKLSDAKLSEASLPSPPTARKRIIPPFIALNDVSRGAMYALQSFLHFAMMLAIM